MNLERLKDLLEKSRVNPRDPLISRINRHLVKEYNKPSETKPKPSHSPSSIGTKCYRKIYYQYFRVDKDIPVDSKGAKIFETGKYYETMVMEWIKALGEHVPYLDPVTGQIPLDRDGKTPNPQFPISSKKWGINKGFIDNIAILDNELWIYEIKSCKATKFTGLEEPLPEHLDQVSIYLEAMKEHIKAGDFNHIPQLSQDIKVRGIKVIYINKDTSDLKVFSLEESHVKSNISKLNRKIQKANEFIANKQLPPKTPDKCSFCPFRDKCSKEWNEI
jgi:hypothetical protein